MNARLQGVLFEYRGSRCGRSKSRAGRHAVLIYLGLEVLDRGERFLGAQTLDEGAAEAASVQIHLALEQMDFEHPVAAIEVGRTPRLATASCQTGCAYPRSHGPHRCRWPATGPAGRAGGSRWDSRARGRGAHPRPRGLRPGTDARAGRAPSRHRRGRPPRAPGSTSRPRPAMPPARCGSRRSRNRLRAQQASASPARSWPNRKSKPITTWRTPRPPASTSCTNCSGDLRIRCSLKASANRCPTPSSPKDAP